MLDVVWFDVWRACGDLIRLILGLGTNVATLIGWMPAPMLGQTWHERATPWVCRLRADEDVDL